MTTGVTCHSATHTTGTETVDHIALENTVFDKNVSLCGISLIVDVDRAPRTGDGTVIDSGYLGVGNLLTELACHLRSTNGNCGSFERVTASLVEDNTAKTVFNSNGHSSCRAVICLEIYRGLTSRFATDINGINKVEKFKAHSGSGACTARLVNTCRTCNGRNCHTGADVAVGGIKSLGVGNKDGVVNAKKGAADLRNRLVIFLCGKASRTQEVCANARIYTCGNNFCRVNIREHTLGEKDFIFYRAQISGCCGNRACTLEKSHTRSIGRGCKYGLGSQKCANTHTGYQIVGGAVDFAVHHIDAIIAGDLAKKLYKISSSAHSGGKYLLCQCFCNHRCISPVQKNLIACFPRR